MIRAAFLLAAICFAAAPEPHPWKEFRERVDTYLKLRKQAVAGLPKLRDKAEPEEIAARKKSAADAIRSARANARQGDVFTPAARQAILGVVRDEMKGKRGAPAKETAKDGNPAYEAAAPVPLKVNAVYPGDAPLSSVPPALLLRLPELPKEVDFRFVGRHLVLHDVEAGLIVDFIPDVMP